MNVVVNGLMANYQRAGAGKAIVCLHGWGDNSGTFAGLTGELKDEYEVWALDLPGFGGSEPPPAGWGLAEYADFVNHFLQKAEVKPYAVIGHSFGGAVAVILEGRWAVSDYLILLASAGIRNKKPLRKKIMTAGAKAGKAGLLLLPAHRRKAIRATVYNSIGSDITTVPHMERTFRIIINQDIRQEARLIKARTLLIYGSRDNSTPISDGHILNRSISGSRLEVISASHFLHQESAAQVAKLIKNFLKN